MQQGWAGQQGSAAAAVGSEWGSHARQGVIPICCLLVEAAAGLCGHRIPRDGWSGAWLQLHC